MEDSHALLEAAADDRLHPGCDLLEDAQGGAVEMVGGHGGRHGAEDGREAGEREGEDLAFALLVEKPDVLQLLGEFAHAVGTFKAVQGEPDLIPELRGVALRVRDDVLTIEVKEVQVDAGPKTKGMGQGSVRCMMFNRMRPGARGLVGAVMAR